MPPRALITGASGHIGLNLARRLNQDGWEVHAIIRPSSNKSRLLEFLKPDKVHIYDGTIEEMQAIVSTAKPFMVFHLAAMTVAQHAPEDLRAMTDGNIVFPLQLMEAMARYRVPYFINTGTIWQHFNNQDYSPVNLYAATKQAVVDLAHYYAETGAFRIIHLELPFVFGPDDNHSRLFSLLRGAIEDGKPLAMTPGAQCIDLVYIDDVVEAYRIAAYLIQDVTRPPVETFAVCSGRPVRLRELVELWYRIRGITPNIQWGGKQYRAREVMIPWNRGKSLPGWRPIVGLEEGIRQMESQIRKGTA